MRIFLTSQECQHENGWGGIGTYTEMLAAEFSRKGHEVTVFAGTAKREPRSLSQEGFEIRKIPSPMSGDFRGLRRVMGRTRVARIIAYSRRLDAEMERYSTSKVPDVVEFPDWYAEGTWSLSRRNSKLNEAARFIRIHGYSRLMAQITNLVRTAGYRAVEMLERYAFRRADALIPNTRWIAEQFREHMGYEIAAENTCYMGVDLGRFQPDAAGRLALRTKLALDLNDLAILSVGRIERRKGYEHILKSISLLPTGLRNRTRLVCVGGGSELTRTAEIDRLNRFASELRIAPPIFVARQSHGELPRYFAATDLYVGASCGESPGLTYLEAMASGRVVIAYNDGAIPEIVPNGVAGALCCPHDHEEMASEIVRFANDRLREETAVAGLQHVRRNFSVAICAARQLSVYERLIAEKHSCKR